MDFFLKMEYSEVRLRGAVTENSVPQRGALQNETKINRSNKSGGTELQDG